MLTLDVLVSIPDFVSFGFLDRGAVLLNKQTSQYYRLDKSGMCFWKLLLSGKTPRESCQVLLDEYEVDPALLEKDMLELLEDLRMHGLVEIIEK